MNYLLTNRAWAVPFARIGVLLLFLAGLSCLAQPAAAPAENNDERGTFQASFYLGAAIDTFAGEEFINYVNFNDSGDLHARAIGGIDFEYRLFGTDQRPKPDKPIQFMGGKGNLWVYGETVHGVRSADVDCANQGKDLLLCTNALSNPANAGKQFFYILRNATSLEGFMGLRYEFLGLQQTSGAPANLYLKAQAGFLDVSGQNSTLRPLHHLGLGAIMTKGDFVNSYLEVGWGRSDTFRQNHGRWKIDGYLERKLPKIDMVSFFAQIAVDTKLTHVATTGRASNAVQTYLGFNLDLKQLFD